MAKISKKLRIKWNFELTVFELTVPDLYRINFNEAPQVEVRKFLKKVLHEKLHFGRGKRSKLLDTLYD